MRGNKMMAVLLLGALAFVQTHSVQAGDKTGASIEIVAVQALKAGPPSNTLSGRVAKLVERAPFPFLYKQFSPLSSQDFSKDWGTTATLKSKEGSKISVTPSLKGKTLMIAVHVTGREGSCGPMRTSYEPKAGGIIPIVCDNLIDGGTVLFFVSAKPL